MPNVQLLDQAHIRQTIAQTAGHPLAHVGVVYPQHVEWGDMDALQHVNNVMYYEYAQRARIFYLESLAMFDGKIYSVIASASCQYLRPVSYPDTLWIGIRAKKIGNTSLTNEYIYFSTAQNAVVALAESVLVFFDETGSQKRAFTEAEKRQLQALDEPIASSI